MAMSNGADLITGRDKFYPNKGNRQPVGWLARGAEMPGNKGQPGKKRERERERHIVCIHIYFRLTLCMEEKY